MHADATAAAKVVLSVLLLLCGCLLYNDLVIHITSGVARLWVSSRQDEEAEARPDTYGLDNSVMQFGMTFQHSASQARCPALPPPSSRFEAAKRLVTATAGIPEAVPSGWGGVVAAAVPCGRPVDGTSVLGGFGFRPQIACDSW